MTGGAEVAQLMIANCPSSCSTTAVQLSTQSPQLIKRMQCSSRIVAK